MCEGWGTGLKNYEKESFLKSFLIFFLSLEVLVGVIFVLYYKDKKEAIEQNIFLEMKNYNFTLEGDKFNADVIPLSPDAKLFVLLQDKAFLYSLYPIATLETFVLKVSYPKEQFLEQLKSLKVEIIVMFLVATFVIIGYALFYSYYSLKPLKEAYRLLEEFLKDIVHDLNTPVTSILLNTKLLRKKHETKFIDRIELSAKTIFSLHGNLQNYLHNIPLQYEEVDVQDLVRQRVRYYTSLYPDLHFEETIEPLRLKTNKNALSRIVDNIINNACKYNVTKGTVRVELKNNTLRIQDTGVGIKNPSKVFERFYKESSRGIGIGLHIVQKLSRELGIDISVHSTKNGTLFIMEFGDEKY
jgi:two-component system OmpR family sensor kinase